MFVENRGLGRGVGRGRVDYGVVKRAGSLWGGGGREK